MSRHQCIFSVNKFYFRNFGRHLDKRHFRSNIATSKTSFLGAPSQDRARQNDCLMYALKKLVLEVLLPAFLKKRMAKLVTIEKPLQVLKVTKIYFFSVVLTVRWSFCVSDLVRRVSFFQRLRGKEEWNGPGTYPQMILKLIHGFSGIQTKDLFLVTGSHNLPKSAIFKT